MFNAAFSRDLIAQREHELRALADLQHTVAAARAGRRAAARASRAPAGRRTVVAPRVAPAGCCKDPG